MNDKTIYFSVEETADITNVDGAKSARDTGGGFGSNRPTVNEPAVRKRRISIDSLALKSQIMSLISVIDSIYSEAESISSIGLSEVEVLAEIDAEGRLSIVGNGGKISNRGGIKLKFSSAHRTMIEPK